MSSLDRFEKQKLEKLFGMSTGYVLNFTDRTFGDFFYEVAGTDIHAEKYMANGTSKANKLRTFWKIEPDCIVGNVLLGLLKEIDELSLDSKEKILFDQCSGIGSRLLTGSVDFKPLKENAVIFESKHLASQIRRMEEAININSDPSLAIGTSKELIETYCKTILAERGKPALGSPKFSSLVKDTLKELKLLPDDIHDSTKGKEIVKRILHCLASISCDLDELRALYGTGHGKHAKTNELKLRHAKLAVGAAATFVTFLFETYMETL